MGIRLGESRPPGQTRRPAVGARHAVPEPRKNQGKERFLASLGMTGSETFFNKRLGQVQRDFDCGVHGGNALWRQVAHLLDEPFLYLCGLVWVQGSVSKFPLGVRQAARAAISSSSSLGDEVLSLPG